MIGVLYFLLALIFLGSIEYYIALVSFGGFNLAFSKFWLVLALCALISIIIIYIIRKKKVLLPTGIKVFIGICLILFITSFSIIEGSIIAATSHKVPANLDYIIVLGAKVNGKTPSLTLTYRLEAAEQYLSGNSKTKAILSGGQGYGEDISEAEAMADYLIKHGINKKRLILEDTSVNTWHNIENSFSMIDNINEKKIGIVTSDFHVFRATEIGKRLGGNNIYGISANTHPLLKVNAYVREYFGVVKDLFLRR